jgi:hypothetical protein
LFAPAVRFRAATSAKSRSVTPVRAMNALAAALRSRSV